MADVKVHKVTSARDKSLPVFQETERLLQRIRDRAFDLFACAGLQERGALDHWLAAEREFCWPAAELQEAREDFELRVAMPGFESTEIEVTATPGELIVHGKSRTSTTEADKGKAGELRWTEFGSNDVYRRIELPASVDATKVTATLQNGMLRIKAPKAAQQSPRAVPVAVAA